MFLLYYLFDNETKKGRYYEIVNKLYKRVNRVGILTSKEKNLMVIEFVKEKSLESASKLKEVINVYEL